MRESVLIVLIFLVGMGNAQAQTKSAKSLWKETEVVVSGGIAISSLVLSFVFAHSARIEAQKARDAKDVDRWMRKRDLTIRRTNTANVLQILSALSAGASAYFYFTPTKGPIGAEEVLQRSIDKLREENDELVEANRQLTFELRQRNVNMSLTLADGPSEKMSIVLKRVPEQKEAGISLFIKKPFGFAVDGADWRETQFRKDVVWADVDKVQISINQVDFSVFLVDLSDRSVDRATLRSVLSKRFKEIRNRRFSECFVVMADGYQSKEKHVTSDRDIDEVLRALNTLGPGPSLSLPNEINNLVRAFRESFLLGNKVRHTFHIFLSNSTYDYLRYDTDILDRSLRNIDVSIDQIVFYINNVNLNDTTISRYRLINVSREQ